jgi:hypothetical protein
MREPPNKKMGRVKRMNVHILLFPIRMLFILPF